jgi:hypothetical protein
MTPEMHALIEAERIIVTLSIEFEFPWYAWIPIVGRKHIQGYYKLNRVAAYLYERRWELMEDEER